MVQVTKSLKDYGRDLGMCSECSQRPLEDYILIRLLKDLEDTVLSCKCDFPVLILTSWPVKDCAPQPSLQGKQLCLSTINCSSGLQRSLKRGKDIKVANRRPLEQSLPRLDGGSYKCSLVSSGCLGLLLEWYLIQVSGCCSNIQKIVSASQSLNSSS